MLRNSADARRPSYFELKLPSFHFDPPSPGFFFNKKWKEKSSSQIGWLSLQTAALACPRMRSLNQWKSS